MGTKGEKEVELVMNYVDCGGSYSVSLNKRQVDAELSMKEVEVGREFLREKMTQQDGLSLPKSPWDDQDGLGA